MRRDCMLAAMLCACASSEQPARPEPGPGPTEVPGAGQDGDGGTNGGDASVSDGLQRSTRSSLQWKRYATFENDLAGALELPAKELCNEFGSEPCVRGVHLGPLGGHDIRTGLLESPPEPLVTTPSVVERVVLSACLARIARERSEGSKVFAPLDLNGAAPTPDSAEARALVEGLTRRFLARDADEDELTTLAALARDAHGAARPADVFASTVCLALGSTSEFLFF